MELKVLDDCGNIQWSNTSGLGTTGLLSASTPQNLPMTEGSFSLSPGKYTITKKLWFPDTAISRIADEFIDQNTGLTTCFKNEDIFIRTSVESTGFPCASSEEPASECDRLKQEMMQELYPGAKYGQYTAGTGGVFLSGGTNSIFSPVNPMEEGEGYYHVRWFYCTGFSDEDPEADPEVMPMCYGCPDEADRHYEEAIVYWTAADVAANAASLCPKEILGFSEYADPVYTTLLPGDTSVCTYVVRRKNCTIGWETTEDPETGFVRVSCTECIDDAFTWVNSTVSWRPSDVANNAASPCPYEIVSGPTGCNYYNPDSMQAAMALYYRYQSDCIDPDVKVTITWFAGYISGFPIYLSSETALKDLTPDQLIRHFSPRVAEGLLPLHPEYCKLQLCDEGDFKEKLQGITSYAQAQQLGMHTLSGILSLDPFNKSIDSEAPFTPYQLSHFPGDAGLSTANANLLRRIDTMALEMAYCGCNASEPVTYCKNVQYKSQIASMSLPNDQVKDLFIMHLKNNYLAVRSLLYQKMMDGSGASCEPCADDRMDLVPNPVFPSAFSPDGLSLSEDLDEVPAWMRAIFDDVLDGSFTSSGEVPSAIKDAEDDRKLADCQGQVAEIMASLANCGLTETKYNTIKTALESTYCDGSSSGADITPTVVKDILVANSVTMNDLCHAFLARYGLHDHSEDFDNGGYIPKHPDFYAGLEAFLARTQVETALKNATTSGYLAPAFPLSPTSNKFEAELATILGYTSGNVTVRGFEQSVFLYEHPTSGPKYRSYYKLSITYSGQSDTLYFSTRNKFASYLAAGTYVPGLSPKAAGTGTTDIIFDNVMNVLEEEMQTGLVPGLVSDNLVFAKLTKNVTTGGPGTTEYDFYNIWGHKTTMLQPLTEGAPEDCITCTELKQGISTFLSQASTYKYSLYPVHPLFGRTMASYLNARFGTQHSFEDLEKLMKGCAISDHHMLISPTSYIRVTYTETGWTNATNFINNLRDAFDTIRIGYFAYRSSTTSIIHLDLSSVPFHRLKAVKDYIVANGGSPKVMLIPGTTNIGYCVTTTGSPTPSVPGITTSGISNVKYLGPDGVEREVKQMSFYNSSTNPKTISNAIDTLQRFMRNSPDFVVIGQFFNKNLYRSDDYSSTEKQDYLDYAYGLSGPSYEIRSALGAAPVKTHVPSLSASTLKLSYTDPECSGIMTDLYYYNESQAGYAGYDLLQSLLNAVRTGLGSGRLFPLTDEVTIPSSGLGVVPFTNLKAFRLQNDGAWYRFFDKDNRLHNVWLMPDGQMIDDASGYQTVSTTVSPVLRQGADTLYHFSVAMKKGTHTVTCQGYTDFPVGLGSKLENVVLYDAKGKTECIVAPCERTVLDQAVAQGRESYRLYRDSLYLAYTSAMKEYFPGAAIDTLFHTSIQQQYHHTLYYYDLAGNLTRTVPPAGVLYVNPTNFPTIDLNRNNSSSTDDLLHKAAHTKQSTYRYNSLNQVVSQQTPDGGLTRYFYDRAGRVVFSQDARQFAYELPRYSYTLYDGQGRIVETGELLDCEASDTVSIAASWELDMTAIASIVNVKQRGDVVATRYDYQLLNLEGFEGLSAQQNMRKRVAAIMYARLVTPTEHIVNFYNYATHFSYDALGNLQTIVHDNPYMDYIGQRFKRIDYEYDLHSGKVNMLSYNRGAADQFYQRYTYDEDNRIRIAESSKDGILWDREAEYDYYKHGPLARQSTGRLNVQQTEYAYTIQGWLKAINGDALNPADDMGAGLDGAGLVTRDVMVHALDYYKGDYKPIGSTQVMHKPGSADLVRSLYNGNIARQTTGMTGLTNLQRDYSYDQLQRILRATYSSYDNVAHTVTSLGSAYRNAYSYDPDGNIQTLTRRGSSGSLVDSFRYYYLAATNNKLGYVRDYITASTTTGDLKSGQATGNYGYDVTGNLVKDVQEGIKRVDWNPYGKMSALYRGTPENDTLLMQLSYDGTGQRVRKDVMRVSADDPEIYVRSGDVYIRDASGNILAVYRNHSTIDGTATIEWILDDIEEGTGGWTVSSGITHLLDTRLGASIGTHLTTVPFSLDAVWANARISSKSLTYYLSHSLPLYTKAVNLNTFYPYFHSIRKVDPDLVAGLMNRSTKENEPLLKKLWQSQSTTQYPSIQKLVQETPSVADGMLVYFQQNPGSMTPTVKVQQLVTLSTQQPANFYTAFETVSGSADPLAYYKSLVRDTVMLDSLLFTLNPPVQDKMKRVFIQADSPGRAAFFCADGHLDLRQQSRVPQPAVYPPGAHGRHLRDRAPAVHRRLREPVRFCRGSQCPGRHTRVQRADPAWHGHQLLPVHYRHHLQLYPAGSQYSFSGAPPGRYPLPGRAPPLRQQQAGDRELP
ncbi:MAG: hypothetical protein KL787_05665 [Taibaiella sp.]|nr:hypothetical protein [Taibaiella sp.]